MFTIIARRVFDFAPYLDGYTEPYASGVGIDGRIFLCAAMTNESRRFKSKAGATFGKTRFDEPTDYIILIWDGSELQQIHLLGESAVIGLVQPHPDGVLLGAANCLWRDGVAEENVLIVNRSGSVVRRGVFGHGISEIRTTPGGTSWVGYTDTGVYGNYGWGLPNGPEPIGRPGLVAFDANCKRVWRYDHRRVREHSIDHVYAMNVLSDDDVWVYAYMRFPIVRIERRQTRVWEYGVGGAKAMAVDGDCLLMVGDYENSDSIRIVRLNDDGTTSVSDEGKIQDERGQPVSRWSCSGVGKDIYVRRGSEILVARDW